MNRVPALVFVALLLGACGAHDSGTASSSTVAGVVKKKIVVTTPVLGDFVSVIGNDQFDVQVLAPLAQDPRRYVMTSADVTAVANADLIIENGLGLEPWFDSFIKTADHKGSVVTATVGVDTRVDDGATDPFTYVSPSNGRVMVANVRDALSQLLPDAKTQFEANERGYDSQIDSTIQYAQQVLTPLLGRKLVYIGEPLGYYCDEFRLSCMTASATAFIGGKSPTDAQVASLVAAVKEANPVVVVFSTDVDAKAVDAVSKATTAKIINGADALSVTSLGDAGSRRSNYLNLQRDIADTLTADLR